MPSPPAEIAPAHRIILALDVDTIREALEWVTRTKGLVGVYKVGLQLFSRCGPRAARAILEHGGEVMLDLKLHDIPNTVVAATKAAAALGVSFLTVHASGGAEMLRDAAHATNTVKILAVTVLTSLAATEGQVLGLARTAYDAGVRGFVASPREASLLRATFPGATIVTPGVRLAGGDPHDQTRVATPGDAIRAGTDYIVVGRPITNAKDPLEALRTIEAEIRAARVG